MAAKARAAEGLISAALFHSSGAMGMNMNLPASGRDAFEASRLSGTRINMSTAWERYQRQLWTL
ncbi:hypothetical protein VE23_10510 [Paenibacillus sp. D9]|nr:hypothetical protein VE23_10510 [Paenibacillus sp. D9]